MQDQSGSVLNRMRAQVKAEIEKRYQTIERFCWDNRLSKGTMSNFFNAASDMKISTLWKIARALGKHLVIRIE